LTLSNDDIINWIEQLEKESKALKKEIIRICWFMRGGITYDQAMDLSFEERQVIAELINDNLDTTKKSGLPFF
jgi:hypothetical protein